MAQGLSARACLQTRSLRCQAASAHQVQLSCCSDVSTCACAACSGIDTVQEGSKFAVALNPCVGSKSKLTTSDH